CRLPIAHCLPNPWLPLLRCCRIDVVDDRLHRIGDASARVLLFQTPSVDVLSLHRAILFGPVVGTRDAQKSNPIVGETRHHRRRWKTHHAPVRKHTDSRLAIARGRSATRLRYPGLRRLDLHVVRKCDRILHVRPLLIHLTVNRGEFRHIGGVETRHVYDRGTVRPVRGNVEYRDDRRVTTRLHRPIDRQQCVGHYRERRRPQYHTISGTLPSESALPKLVAAIRAEWIVRVDRCCPRIAPHQQHVAIQLLRRNLEVQRIANTMSLEQSVTRFRVLGDDLGIRLDRNVPTASPSGIRTCRIDRASHGRERDTRRRHACGNGKRCQHVRKEWREWPDPRPASAFRDDHRLLVHANFLTVSSLPTRTWLPPYPWRGIPCPRTPCSR